MKRLAGVVALAILGACAPLRPAPPPPPPSVPAPVPAPAPTPAPAVSPDAALLSSPDAVPKQEPRARLGNPPFYEVYGIRYTVLPDSSGFVERGVASWYGRDFHGARTATGELYDMYGMTAAHRVLPLPTYVRVTNLSNGRSVVVRVNDRGPFKSNRIIDLSYTAALKLDMLRTGTTLVEVRALVPDGPPPPAPPPPPAAHLALYAQVGAFASESNANRLRERIAQAGISGAFVRRDELKSQVLYRVRVGPIGSVDDYDALSARLRDLGLGEARLALD
jgi:rare lipoprotein A